MDNETKDVCRLLFKDHTMRFIKEINDIDVIDTGVKSILDNGKDDFLPHFIYSGDYYLAESVHESEHESEYESRFREMFLAKMKYYGIPSAVLTKLVMCRFKLVTKETVKKAYKGEMKNDKDWNNEEGSINDDLENFFINNIMQDQNSYYEEKIDSFFTPKLTEEEMKLVEERNENHLRSYIDHSLLGLNVDVNVHELKRSNSRSKFVHVYCYRKTEQLKVALKRKNEDN